MEEVPDRQSLNKSVEVKVSKVSSVLNRSAGTVQVLPHYDKIKQ
jgi:hypothetical protein